MSDRVTLYGFGYSAYVRVVRMVLHRKAVPYDHIQVDPFAGPDPAYLALHPFGRVPALTHGSVRLFECSVITRYLDEVFAGPSLAAPSPVATARMNQVIAVIDHYGYWPMVRQVFGQRVFGPLEGEAADEGEIAAGLEASGRVLAVLDQIASEGLVLNGRDITLADCHLAPMIAYFVLAPEGAEMLASYPALTKWWEDISKMPMVQATDPKLSELGRFG